MTSDRINESAVLFEHGYNCSQAVFSVFAKENNLDPNLAGKIATALGAGISRTGNICGAVSGAILAVGLIHGMNNCEDTEGKEKSYQVSQEFVKTFTDRYGSVSCKTLLGYDLGDPVEREEAGKKGVVKQICPPLVQGAVEILEEILAKN
jgi:C_GCAxxG_C_C family probable redox protein